MSDAPVVAENSALICFGAMSFVTGAGAGIAPFAVPLAVLAAIGLRFRAGKRANCCVAAQDAALEALRASKEFDDEVLARAAVLLEDRSRKIRIEPARMVDAAEAGGAKDFDRELAKHLMRGVYFERGEEAVRRAIEIAFVTAIGTCRRHPDIDRDLTQTFLIESARSQSIAIERLEVMGAKVDEILRLLRESGALHQAEVAGVTGFAIQMLVQKIAPEVENTEQALHELERAVEIAVRVREEGRHGSNLGDFVDEVLRRSAELAAKGGYDAADDEIEEALRREAEESRAREVRLLERGVDTALLKRDAATGAKRIARRTELKLPDGANLYDALRAVQVEWFERYERDKGVNLDLEVLIRLGEIALQAAANPDERVRSLNDLGFQLYTLGKRESGTARLEEAVSAYQAVLKEWTRDCMPLDWAMTQNNLGNALGTLGERENGTVRLDQAVAAHRAALEEYTRDRVPLDWAMTQNSLGNALGTLGERESGTERLEEAIVAYRAALEEYTRDRVPLDWAMTQINLGTVLTIIGERENGMVRLNQAVAAYQAALEEYTRERMPLEWATTQNNLGNALQYLGKQEGGTARLEEAASAYRVALEEFSEEETPSYWAATKQNLQMVLKLIEDRQ